ncbi:MAG: SGNH/GDSL hydrolase family protein [Verrucomicrobiota bacterium]
MKTSLQFTIGILLFGLAVLPAHAAFNSLYVFGDALSTTTNNTSGLSCYYGQRFSNGRVWVEVLAQRQGLTYDAAKNNSYYDHNSAELVTELNSFTAPSDVTNDLFIVWVCNADTFDAASVPDTSNQWVAAINQAQTNHLQIITNLYAKGVRTLILPNVVDISEIPAFNAGTTLTNVEHAGCVDYNFAFSNTINQARALCPGLNIYAPDFFTLLNNVLTNAASYGLTNALSSKGFSIDAYSDPALPILTLNGPGTNYIFWDPQDPTAKFHEVIADVVQQFISPVQVSRITAFAGSNRLDVANMPVGLNGFVDGCTNLAMANWTAVQNITSTNTTQSIFVPTPAPTNAPQFFVPADQGPFPPGPGGTPVVTALEFYRLRFPFAWNWP